MAKDTKKQKTFTPPYVSADIFIRVAETKYQFEDIQAKAFKVRMRSKGKYFLPTLEDFVPYFEKYLGIESEDK